MIRIKKNKKNKRKRKIQSLCTVYNTGCLVKIICVGYNIKGSFLMSEYNELFFTLHFYEPKTTHKIFYTL